MKLRIGCLIVLFVSLLPPMAAQRTSGRAKSSAAAPTQVFNAAVHINGPSGGNDGQDAPIVLLVKGGQGGTGGVDNENGGMGGGIEFRASAGGDSSQDAGSGGSITFKAGAGGTSSELGGSGGSITLQPGTHRCGVPGLCGLDGNVILDVPGKGFVGIGTASPSNTLEVRMGGMTLADSWTVRSSRRFKNNIEPLAGALEKVERLRGVSYERKDDGRREIGVVAEEVDKIVPEVVSRDPQSNEVQGVDYSRLTALLIEAVKAQEAEIRELKTQVEELSADQAGR